MTLTVAVISKNSNLDDEFIQRLSFADEIIIVSELQNSNPPNQDKVKYYFHPLNHSFAEQRNFALSKAKGDWVLFVDTDEVVSAQLAAEIIEIIGNTKLSGYYLKRLDTVFHQLQLHGETGNIKILRLAKRNAGLFTRSVHEQWLIKGKKGELINPLFHTKDNFISEFIGRISFYGPIDALSLQKEGKPYNIVRLLIYPKAKFVLNYFMKTGFLDGLPGLFNAYLMSVQSLSVRVFQWTLQKQSIG